MVDLGHSRSLVEGQLGRLGQLDHLLELEVCQLGKQYLFGKCNHYSKR